MQNGKPCHEAIVRFGEDPEARVGERPTFNDTLMKSRLSLSAMVDE